MWQMAGYPKLKKQWGFYKFTKKYWSFFLYRQNQSSNEIAPKTWTMFDSTRYAKSNVSNNNKKTVMEEGKKKVPHKELWVNP